MKAHNNDNYTLHGYTITEDPLYLEDKSLITPSLKAKIERLYHQVHEGASGAIKELKSLISVYPSIPVLKNYMMVAYQLSGNAAKANQINKQILEEHPDYLFGKTNEGFRLLHVGELHLVEELMGNEWSLNALYPERNLFHVSEVANFHTLATMFFCQKKDLEQAEKHYKIVEDVAPHDANTERAFSFLAILRLEFAGKRWEEQRAKEVVVKATKELPAPVMQDSPSFHHPEIYKLYEEGLHIPDALLTSILSLPRTTLVEDLVAVLADSVNRFHAYKDLDWDEDTQSFPIHALWLLKELGANEALPQVLTYLEYGEELLDFWFTDYLPDTWQCFYVLGLQQPKMLLDFLLKPGVDSSAKMPISKAMVQMGVLEPQMREEIVGYFSLLFETFTGEKPAGNLLDTRFLTYTIGYVVDVGYTELLPLIKQLYEQDYVDVTYNGPYEDTEKHLREYALSPKKETLNNIHEYYQIAQKFWQDIEDEESYLAFDEDFDPLPDYAVPVAAVSQKVGRNEPCPCGSGKKYKKCCGANG